MKTDKYWLGITAHRNDGWIMSPLMTQLRLPLPGALWMVEGGELLSDFLVAEEHRSIAEILSCVQFIL